MTALLSRCILPPATLGMLGGGQLGRFFVTAAHEMGYKVWVLDPDPQSPAGRIADRHIAAAYDDPAALETLASCAAITTEFENVPAETLHHLAQRTVVHPSAAAVAICQNRIEEKTFFIRHNIPCGPFAAIHTAEDIAKADENLFPAILKVARLGYDGKGQTHVSNREEALKAFEHFQELPCILEKKLYLDSELSIVLARDQQGAICCYPAGENTHHNGILDTTIAPATQAPALTEQAQHFARQIAEQLNYVGTLAVEFFVSQGKLFANEIAPRPHNSGHHTLDACTVSQYEQQLRALCALPLGEIRQHSTAVMVNLLGDIWFKNDSSKNNVTDTCCEPDWSALYATPGLCLHLYGKHEARPGRKMGHFTLVGNDLPLLLSRTHTIRQHIGIDNI